MRSTFLVSVQSRVVSLHGLILFQPCPWCHVDIAWDSFLVNKQQMSHLILCHSYLDIDPVTERGWPDLAYTELLPETMECLSDMGPVSPDSSLL